jgi:hypothetical protein
MEMLEVFGEFLRAPNAHDRAWLLEQNATHGFQGILDSLIACIGEVRKVP